MKWFSDADAKENLFVALTAKGHGTQSPKHSVGFWFSGSSCKATAQNSACKGSNHTKSNSSQVPNQACLAFGLAHGIRFNAAGSGAFQALEHDLGFS